MNKSFFWRYYLTGIILMLVLVSLLSFTFVKNNLERISEKETFESIYFKTSIDFIVPGPSAAQVEELESDTRNGIRAVTPYYETTAAATIHGASAKGTSILFPSSRKMEFTPYNAARIISGRAAAYGGEAVADRTYVARNSCKIGDIISISIDDRSLPFTIVGICEDNTIYSEGTIGMVLNEADARQFEQKDIRYSAAYIAASDATICETYLYSDYKPLARLKDSAEFGNDEVYEQYVVDFYAADWSREITNFHANYITLSTRYDNVQVGVWSNIGIISLIMAAVIIVFHMTALTMSSANSAIKASLKKGESRDSVKAFYRNGIFISEFFLCLASILLYGYLASARNISIISIQAMNCILPIFVSLFVSVVLAVISNHYIDKRYKGITPKKEVRQQDCTTPVSVKTRLREADTTLDQAKMEHSQTFWQVVQAPPTMVQSEKESQDNTEALSAEPKPEEPQEPSA